MSLWSRCSSILAPVLLVGTLVFTGCASKKTATDSASDANAANSGLNLELYGDSDSGKAGPLKTVYFPYDSSEISGESKSVLDQNAAFLKDNKIKVQVEGHCDERGGIEYNLALGEKRANSIRDYLVALGIPGERLTTISYGKEEPVEAGHEEAAWSKNRRGNFVVTEK